MRPRKTLEPGQRFGRLLVVREVSPGFYLCKCDCGAERQLPRGNLVTGNTKSCGCLSRDLARERIKLARSKRHVRTQ